MPPLSDLLPLHHAWLEASLPPGGVMLDATMGNGHDTLFLVQIAGPQGLVLAMDKQPQALKKTSALLMAQGFTPSARLRLILADHADMEAILAKELPPTGHAPGDHARIDAALFNLGFLPGGDKTLTTLAHSTLTALNAVWKKLSPGGMLSVHTYTGHPGGSEESANVEDWMAALPRREARVIAMKQHNKPKNPETLYLVLKNPAFLPDVDQMLDKCRSDTETKHSNIAKRRTI